MTSTISLPASARERRICCFAGHVDVVPPGPRRNWTHPPFAAEQAGGFIYGRGAADMKGSVAAFAAAAIASVKEGGLPGSLSLHDHRR